VTRTRASNAARAFARVGTVQLDEAPAEPTIGEDASISASKNSGLIEGENAARLDDDTAVLDASEDAVGNDGQKAVPPASEDAGGSASLPASLNAGNVTSRPVIGNEISTAGKHTGSNAGRADGRKAGKRSKRRVGRPRGPERVPLTIRILAATDERLTEAVEATGQSPQYIVDAALAAYLDALGMPKPSVKS
jgi:hypothetical protein